jgi:hypothetical protein
MRRLRLISFLTIAFLIITLVIFFSINAIHLSYSTPKLGDAHSSSNGPPFPVSIGPRDNSTGVLLDTKIVVFTFRWPSVTNLTISPQVPIREVVFEPDLASYTTFYFSELLKSNTTYNFSVMVGNEKFESNFTTTPESPSLLSQVSRMFANNLISFSLIMAFFITLVIGLVIRAKTGISAKNALDNKKPL